MQIDSPLQLSGMRMANALMNGAYIGSKTLEDIESLCKGPSGAVVVGSISVKPRLQNSGPGYWRHKEKFYSLNSYGMPNGGIPYFKQRLPEMVDLAHAASKPLIANIVGFTPEEFADLVKFVERSGADLVELNLGCPNVWDEHGEQKRILSYQPLMVEKTLTQIKSKHPSIPIALKLSPLPPDILMEVAEVAVKSKIVSAITATNSYPNALTSTGTKTDDEDVLAGLTGRALKPISLGVVRQLRALLPGDIEIIGCGGISSANDAMDFLNAGAKAVQIATALVDEGLSVFSKILYQAEKLNV